MKQRLYPRGDLGIVMPGKVISAYTKVMTSGLQTFVDLYLRLTLNTPPIKKNHKTEAKNNHESSLKEKTGE